MTESMCLALLPCVSLHYDDIKQPSLFSYTCYCMYVITMTVNTKIDFLVMCVNDKEYLNNPPLSQIKTADDCC